MGNKKALSKYSRAELLDLLYQQQKKIEDLEAENKGLKKELEEKMIRIEGCGSIAEASLALTDIFKQAQMAADMYLENVKMAVPDAKVEAIKQAPVKQQATAAKPKQAAVPVNKPKPQVQPQPQQQVQPQPRPQVKQQPVRPQQTVKQNVQPQPQYQQVRQSVKPQQNRQNVEQNVYPQQVRQTVRPQQTKQVHQNVVQYKARPASRPVSQSRPVVQRRPVEQEIDYADYDIGMNDSPISIDDELNFGVSRSNGYNRQNREANNVKRDLVSEMEMDILGQFDRVKNDDATEQYNRSRHAKRRRGQ